MSRIFKNVEIKRALKKANLNINEKIKAFQILKNFRGLNSPIRDIKFGGYYNNTLEIEYESTMEGKSMEGIVFVKNSEFFYGLPIAKIEFFAKYVTTFNEKETFEIQTDWSKGHCISTLEEPNHYDMALINGKFWTFAPNVSEIKEIAFQA